MSDNPPFPLSMIKRPGVQETADYEAFLDALPFPALLIDIQSRRIWLTNEKLVELSGHTRAELTWKELALIFRQPQKHSPAAQASNTRPHSQPGEKLSNSGGLVNEIFPDYPSSDSILQAELLHRNRSFQPVELNLALLPGKTRRALIIIESNQVPGAWPKTSSHTKIVSAFQEIARAPLENALAPSLEILLQAGAGLTGADVIAIYAAQENSPTLKRSTSFGDCSFLPEMLPAQEVIQLREPQTWTTGKRATCTLHRTARTAQLTWLSTSPIGQNNATVGLFVMGSQTSPPSDGLSLFSNLLAITATQLFQNHFQRSSLLSQIKTLATQQSVFNTMEEYVGEGIVVLSNDLKIIRMNPAAELMLGFGSQETRGQQADKILIGTETIYPALAAAMQGSCTYNLSDVLLYRRNGEAFQASIRIFPIRTETGVENILMFLQDLSEKELLRLHNQQLENRAILGEVTAIFAHEVRNPINNISTGLQLLAINLPENDANQHSIERLLQDCDRLAELIKSVLTFSRPTEYEFERVDLALLIRHLLERLHPRISRLNIQYSLQVDPECTPVLGNLRALEQVFNNLISNALQAMGEGGRLAIRLQQVYSPEGKNYIETSIADNGPGIPKELQDKIFLPFFTTNQNGTGLGLAITKRIITAHKGTILLTSFPGGTIFHVQLPAISGSD